MSCDVDTHKKECKENDISSRDTSIGGIKPSLVRKKATKADYQTFDQSNGASLRIPQSTNDSHADHSHQENGAKVRNGRRIALRDFFTVLALSVHAVFEGMAIGLEDHSADIWILFAGTSAHNSFFKVTLVI